MLIAHRIALQPTAAQERYFVQASGVARFAWNWALAKWRQEYALWNEYQVGPKPSQAWLRRELNAVKDRDFPWMRAVTKNAPQQAIKNLGSAFTAFFEGRSGYPEFKKKGKCRDSFRADPGPDKTHPNAVEVQGKRVKLPLIGWVRMREQLRFTGQVKSATVSRTAGRWFVALMVETDTPLPLRSHRRKNQAPEQGVERIAVGGVDLGIKAMATPSEGEAFEGPKAFRKHLKALKRRNRALHRKAKGSANRRKAASRLARLHARIANIRRDALHKATTAMTRRFRVIGIEELNVRGMMANGHLARAIADVGMYEFRRQLEYKARLRGATIVVAPRFFPSSKLCSACGHRHACLTLSEREWTCEGCGVEHDRDRNAALNLRNYAASGAVSACGAEGNGDGPAAIVEPTALLARRKAPQKQEVRKVGRAHARPVRPAADKKSESVLKGHI